MNTCVQLPRILNFRERLEYGLALNGTREHWGTRPPSTLSPKIVSRAGFSWIDAAKIEIALFTVKF